VQEIVPVKKTTVIHHAPPFVRGVINLRGKVVTVIDLGEKLLLGSVEQNDENRILIVDWKQENVGLLVDSMS
jgi:purine-binding chemotaxis protein CheW